MRNIWVYEKGNWSEEDRVSLGFPDVEWEHYEKYLEENGYWPRPHRTFGDLDYFGMEIRTHSKNNFYLIDLVIYGSCEVVVIKNLPSFLMFLNEFRGLFIEDKIDFVNIGQGHYLNKKFIQDIVVRGGHKKEDQVSVIVYDNKGEKYDLDECPSGYISSRLKVEFGIDR